jgi:hypothetical protein
MSVFIYGLSEWILDGKVSIIEAFTMKLVILMAIW